MEEKRKSKRLPININLKIKSLYRSGDNNLDSIDEEVNVVNISKRGIGFVSKTQLPIGYFFNAKITIDNEKMFYSVLRIVRNEKSNDGYMVGCEFVGLADILSESVDEYEEEIEK